MDRLLGEDIGHQRTPRELGRAVGVTRPEGELVPAVALIVPTPGQELVAAVEMQAQPVDRLGDDALHLYRHAPGIDVGGRIETELEGERRETERLRVEVVECSGRLLRGQRSMAAMSRRSSCWRLEAFEERDQI